ncbi:hypothetical protein ACFQ30_15630, partial [Devosia equisanguinis]
HTYHLFTVSKPIQKPRPQNRGFSASKLPNPGMNNDTFNAQCSACFALCCTALSFQRGTQFAHDKPAGQPCHNLAADFSCRIHARREELGYDGCEAFDCLGAGQRASAMFAGENWQRDASVARRLYASFSMLLRLQEMRQALTTAADLDLPPDLHNERQGLLDRLAELAESGREDLAGDSSTALAAAKTFLKRLANVIAV